MLLLPLALALLVSIPKVSSHSSSSTPRSPPTDWSGWGGNTNNNRWSPQNTFITSYTIPHLHLTPHCQTPGPISATPVTSGNVVYVPTWTGLFLAYDYTTCRMIWQINVTSIIQNYAPISAVQGANTSPVSRTSPQIDKENGVLFFGTQTHALVVAIDQATGQTLGVFQVNPHPLAVLTMSPTFYNGKLFIGASSNEEVAASDPNYACCSFVGNIMALTFDRTGGIFTVRWNISTIPSSEVSAGWSGVSVWGSQPSIDTSRGQVFVGTGNVYTIPQAIIDCQKTARNITTVDNGLVPDPCLPRSVLQESVLAIDIEVGTMNWVQQLPALDAWTLACGIPGVLPPNPSCPQLPGPDADFGMSPTFIPSSSTISTPHGKDTLIIGQKNGNLYAMSAQDGEIFWSVATSPGSPLGGLSWGLAVDDSRVYYTAINAFGATWTLSPSGQIINNSAYGAASLYNGSILWETAVPAGYTSLGPPSVVGDLVLVAKSGVGDGFTVGNGSLMVLGKEDGKILREVDVDATFHGGVAVVEGNIMFGTGYEFAHSQSLSGSLHVLRVG